jgi:hypothetical protein
MAHPYSRGKRINSNWDADEKYAIAAEALRRMKEDANLSRIEALRGGVLVLDKSRQKEIPDMAHAKWAPPLWEKIAAELDAANAELPAPASRSR